MKIFKNNNGLTVADLKKVIKNWPETDDNGEPCEIWIGNDNGTSNIAVEIGPLNKRDNGQKKWADIYIEHR